MGPPDMAALAVMGLAKMKMRKKNTNASVVLARAVVLNLTVFFSSKLVQPL